MFTNIALCILVFVSSYTPEYLLKLQIKLYPGVVISMVTSILSFIISFYKLISIKKDDFQEKIKLKT